MLPLLKHSIHQGWYLKPNFFCTGQPEFILAHRVRTKLVLLDQHLLWFLLAVLECMVNFWLPEKCSFATKYFSSLLDDNELCQKFLKEKQWILKKDVGKSVPQRKCAPKLALGFEKPIEHGLKSWSMSQAGIVDLSTSYHKPTNLSAAHTQICSTPSQKRSL